MEGHAIVCGLGRNGRQVVSKLRAYGADVVVIEKDEHRADEFRNLFDKVLVVVGDATDDAILEKVSISKAASLISALASDTDNLFVVISARQLNQILPLVHGQTQESTERKLLAAGASYTVSPNLVGGAHLAHNPNESRGNEFLGSAECRRIFCHQYRRDCN